MKYFLYDKIPEVIEPGGFEESSSAEKSIWEALSANHVRVDSIQDADIAFIKINNASGYYGGDDIVSIWRDTIEPMLIRCGVPHVAIFAYVINKIDLKFIPDWITIWAYESECSDHESSDLSTTDSGCGDRVCVIPYKLSAQSNPAAGLVADTVILADNFHHETWENRRGCVHIGSATYDGRPRIASRHSAAKTWADMYDCDIFSDRQLVEPNSKYADYKFALVLRGDTPTRKAFYQAICAGSFPIVTETAWQVYSELYRGQIGDLSSFVVVIPDDCTLWDKTKIDERLAHICDNAATLLPSMLSWAQHFIDYAEVTTKAISATISGESARNTPMLYVHRLMPPELYRPQQAWIGEYEKISPDNIHATQYSAEHIIYHAALKHPYKTGVLAKASAAYVPIYPFLCSWQTPGFYSVADSAATVRRAIAALPEWHTSTVPHFVVYGDVLWDDDRVFLGHVDMPKNTTIIALETSSHSTRQLAVPFPVGVVPDRPEDGHRELATYVGRRRDIISDYPISVHTIETNGWHSSNSHDSVVWSAYHTHMFSLQPHGDRATRRGFYQSVVSKCVPVITADCVPAYSSAIGTDVSAFCVVLPEWPRDLLSILSASDYARLSPKLPNISIVQRALAHMGLAGGD